MFTLTESDRAQLRSFERPIAFFDVDHEIAYEDITTLITHYHAREEKWLKHKKRVALVLQTAFAVASLVAMVIPLFYGHLWWIGFPIFFGGGIVLILPSSLLKNHVEKKERIHAAMCQERQMLVSCGNRGKYPLSVFNIPKNKLLDTKNLMSDGIKASEIKSKEGGNRISRKQDPHGRVYPKSNTPLRSRRLAGLDLAETVASKHQRAGIGHLLDPLEDELWQRKRKAVKEARSYDGLEELEREPSRWAWFKPHWQKAKEANSVKGIAEQTLKEPSMLFQAVDGVTSEQKRSYEKNRLHFMPLINTSEITSENESIDVAYKFLLERVDNFWEKTKKKKADAAGAPYFEGRYKDLKQAILVLPKREAIVDRNALLAMKKRVVEIEEEAKKWRKELPVKLLKNLEIEINGLKALHQMLQSVKEDQVLSFDFDHEYAALQREFARLKIRCSNDRIHGEKRYYEMAVNAISIFRKEQLRPLAKKVAGEQNEPVVLSILKGVGQGCKKVAKAMVFRFDIQHQPDLVLKTSAIGVQAIGSRNRSINTLLYDADKKLTRWLYVNKLWIKAVALIINIVLIVLVFVIGANSPWIGGALLVPALLIPAGLYFISRHIKKIEGRKLEAKLAKHLLERMPLHLDEISTEKQQLRHLIGRLSYLDLEQNTLTLARLNEDPNCFAFDKRYKGKGPVAKVQRKLASLQMRVPKKWQNEIEPDQLLRRRLVADKRHLENRLKHLEAMADVYAVRQSSLEEFGFESQADFKKNGHLAIDHERNQKRLNDFAELEISLDEEESSIKTRLAIIDVMLENYPLFVKKELELELNALYEEGNRIGKSFDSIDQDVVADHFNIEEISIKELQSQLSCFRSEAADFEKELADLGKELKSALDDESITDLEEQIADLEEKVLKNSAIEHALFTTYLYRRFAQEYPKRLDSLTSRIKLWNSRIKRDLTEEEEALLDNNHVEKNLESL